MPSQVIVPPLHADQQEVAAHPARFNRGFQALEAARTRLPGPTVSTPERVTEEKYAGPRPADLRRRAQGYAGRRS